jgi:hypothetical protein
MSDIAKDKASTSNAPCKRRAKPVESFIEFDSALGELAVIYGWARDHHWLHSFSPTSFVTAHATNIN